VIGFLRGLAYHTFRAFAGLVAVVAVIVGGVMLVWMALGRQSETAGNVAERLRAAPAPVAAEASPPVRVVEPARQSDDLTPQVTAGPAVPPPAKPEKPRIDTAARIDQFARDYFPAGSYLVETDTPSRPKTCNDRREAVLRVSLWAFFRSEIERDEMTAGEGIADILTAGLSRLGDSGNERWTVFSVDTDWAEDDRYVTFTLGAPRRGAAGDTAGAQTRLTLYKIDDRHLGLVERVPLATPEFRKPPKGPPKILAVYLRCIDRKTGDDNP
jgi:hypothetical protein